MNDEFEKYMKLFAANSGYNWVRAVEQMAEELTKRDEKIEHLRCELLDIEQDVAELRMALQDRIAEVEKLGQLATTLSVIATKHCPKDHHDWQRVLELTEKL
jgi:chromosome segregation ATPase